MGVWNNAGMAQAFLALGSNLGDRRGLIDAAVGALRAEPGVGVVALSPVYETDPVGPADQGKYLNAAALVETELEPGALLSAMLRIETRLGRASRSERVFWGPRPIDLDLLLYDDRVIDEPGLTVPHPRLHERDFVLRPLVDLVPERVHPVLGRTFLALLGELEDAGKGEK